MSYGKFRSIRRTSDQDEDSDSEAQKDEKRAQVNQEIDERVAALAPTARMLFDRTRPLISDALVKRVEMAKPALIIVQVISHEWRQSVYDAIGRALDDAVRNECIVYCQYYHVPSDDFSNRSWQRKGLRERSQQVMSMLSSGITIVALAVGEELEPAVMAMADLEIDLTRFDASDLKRTVLASFPDSSLVWPVDLTVTTIDPHWLDIAIGRSVTADEATRIIVAAHQRQVTPSAVPKLEDLHGYGEAGEWGLRLVAALAEYRAGQRDWADVDAGALLVGPPGTGKTLFASALASSCGSAFVPTSFSAWQSTGEGHLGNVTQAIRKTFAEAAGQSPCIIFIDEIDTLPARGATTRHDDWWRSIVNCLLECLDGTGRREGVIVLAACNDDLGLDPALVRSGRLDRKFFVGLPSEEDLVKILVHHLPMIPEADLQPAAVTLAGSTSGADAARIARDARQRARGQRRDPNGSDVLACQSAWNIDP